MPEKKIAIVCYYYSFEVSVVLKSICSFFYDRGYGKTSVFVDRISRNKHFNSKGTAIISFREHNLFTYLYYTRIKKLSYADSFVRFIKDRIKHYDLILAADFPSLLCLYNSQINLNKVVFLSFEGIDFMNSEGREKPAIHKLLNNCCMRVIQNKERGEDISKFLHEDINFDYLPVSMRPVALYHNNLEPEKLKIIYSGFFGKRTGLIEFLEAYQEAGCYEFCRLLIQGHVLGTENYAQLVNRKIKEIQGVKTDYAYYDDESHHRLLSSYDIGLAFYENPDKSSNFNNLINSSGKIACYLWAGLAVMTNINTGITRYPPFIFVENYSPQGIRNALKNVMEQKELYFNSSLALAGKSYNFDTYFSEIEKKLKVKKLL